MAKILIFLVKGYQKIISPLLPGRCRFNPTCSQYLIDALVKYGFFKGLWKGLKRIIKCHPWHPGGYDPA
ncbi:MAG: membrane protein insertion efficiency factor YidD [Bacillota bacterium]|jgi:putative membrane protein insertion efficiency factor